MLTKGFNTTHTYALWLSLRFFRWMELHAKRQEIKAGPTDYVYDVTKAVALVEGGLGIWHGGRSVCFAFTLLVYSTKFSVVGSCATALKCITDRYVADRHTVIGTIGPTGAESIPRRF